MARIYLLTKGKRNILEVYLFDRTQRTGFRVLKQQILNIGLQRIETDLRFIKELLARERGGG